MGDTYPKFKVAAVQRLPVRDSIDSEAFKNTVRRLRLSLLLLCWLGWCSLLLLSFLPCLLLALFWQTALPVVAGYPPRVNKTTSIGLC